MLQMRAPSHRHITISLALGPNSIDKAGERRASILYNAVSATTLYSMYMYMYMTAYYLTTGLLVVSLC